MLERLRNLVRTPPEQTAAVTLHTRIVAAARAPALYREGGVPDTVDGRFDLIALHAFLLFHRLSGAEGWQPVGDRLADRLMADMDRSLREMGVGDMSVGKKMKTVATAFYGRLDAYWGALADTAPGALADALARNVYRADPASAPEAAAAARRLAHYARGQVAALAEQPTARLLTGDVRFAEAAPLLAADGDEAGTGGPATSETTEATT